MDTDSNNSATRNGRKPWANGLRQDTNGQGFRPAAPERDSGRIAIFLAEDQPLVRHGLKSLISGERDMLICGEASNCVQTWREVRRLRPQIVIMELSMQAENTIGLIRRINELGEWTNVVVYSRHDEQVYAIPTFKAGARAFVMKQDPPAVIIEAIRKVQSGQLRFSEIVNSQILNRIATHRTDRQESSVSSLSPRELEVVTLIASGLSSREIAQRLDVSIKTVEAHRAHIKQKANLESGTALVRYSMNVTSENPMITV